MLRGCQKKVYFLRSVESELFEEAYFILKEPTAEKKPHNRDMVREASRLLLSALTENEKKKLARQRHLLRLIFSFAVGALCGSGICLLCFL